MFYLEVVHVVDGRENCFCHLHDSFDAVKEALAGIEWIRYVTTEVTV